MAEDDKLSLTKSQLKKALSRLAEVLAMPKSDIVRDSAIQRFEFCFDLCWKCLKVALEKEFGVSVASPKAAFREAFKQGLIDHDKFWLTLTDLRNRTAHTYLEQIAEQVFAELPQALENFKKVSAKLG